MKNLKVTEDLKLSGTSYSHILTLNISGNYNYVDSPPVYQPIRIECSAPSACSHIERAGV